MGVIDTDCVEGIGVVTLNDPARRNAITVDLADELADALAHLEGIPSVRAVVVTGAGSAFCAGADRGALIHADEQVLRRIYEAFLLVRNFRLPTVAAVNGPAVGAGFNLALACDVRIAAESAAFDARFIQIPIHPGGGHTWMLNELVGPQAAAAVTLFGAAVDGARAKEIGLAWSCVPDSDLLPASFDFCRTITRAPRALAVQVKSTLRSSAQFRDHAQAMEHELREQLTSVRRPEFREQFKVGR
ncbi:MULTISPECIES: enoyl-CoA hydratase-related protein [Rhodococcus]|jgi:enoyl-CoA hydratase|uniref:Enoyl-CoA hydratase n=1 Tax=Rhodococcus jostii TaxID=132919 RepID=A0A1H4IWW1_RHOJO|nr:MULTISPECIES: enoyl-CoA hydratase-related protein [Rhodococcus]RZI53904.1 MAG: enoyl-CoA hydratase [Pseudonocardia sp.]GLK33672.1 enoyl-CoA hydratase [Rhodococcus wratislaviensis]SEB38106.1 enoyl-CoA hydratase [Rhodococcus jostii]